MRNESYVGTCSFDYCLVCFNYSSFIFQVFNSGDWIYICQKENMTNSLKGTNDNHYTSWQLLIFLSQHATHLLTSFIIHSHHYSGFFLSPFQVYTILITTLIFVITCSLHTHTLLQMSELQRFIKRITIDYARLRPHDDQP